MCGSTIRPSGACGWAAWVTPAVAMMLAGGGFDGALASQGPGVADGTAEPITRATAAAMALFPPVAIAVFAMAKLLFPNDR